MFYQIQQTINKQNQMMTNQHKLELTQPSIWGGNQGKPHIVCKLETTHQPQEPLRLLLKLLQANQKQVLGSRAPLATPNIKE